jgi:hypothetical protein
MFSIFLQFSSTKNLNRQRWFAYLMVFAIVLLFPMVGMTANQVTLGWDANDAKTLAGYRIYYKKSSSGQPYNGTGLSHEGTSADSPIGIPLSSLSDPNSPQITLTGLTSGESYYFVATAYDSSGNESPYSNEVTQTAGQTDDSNADQGSSADTAIVVDNGDSSSFSTGIWQISGAKNPFGQNSLYSREAGATYTFDSSKTGKIDISLWWTQLSNRTSSVPIKIYDGDKLLKTVYVNQQSNGGKWNPIASGYTFLDSARVTIVSEDYTTTCADAVQFSIMSDDTNPPVQNPVPLVTTHQIIASTNGNGTISPAGVTSLDEGQSVTYSMLAAPHHHLTSVQVDSKDIGKEGSYTFNNINADHTILASFAPNDYTISANAGANGSISPSGKTAVAYGKNLSYAITPNPGYQIAKVVVDGNTVNTEPIYTFSNVAANHNIEVFFAPASFVVTAKAEQNGFITPHGDISIEKGRSLTLEISPDTGYRVADVLIDGQSMGALRTYTIEDITSNHIVTAKFELVESTKPVFEFGELDIDHNWSKILFKRQFADPVVVAGPMSLNGSDRAVVRIRNVSPTGFEIRVQEWPYLDVWHAFETVGYMVMERGSYLLEDGTRLEASIFQTDGISSNQPVLFEQSYNEIPIIASSVVSFSEKEAITGRLSSIDTEGFRYQLQAQEANPAIQAVETIAYIAWEPSSGTLNGLSYEINRTRDIATDAFLTIPFNSYSKLSPTFLADMQSFDGSDPAGIRWKDKNTASVQVQISEEQSKDEEVYHTTEIIGYMLLYPLQDTDNDGLTNTDEQELFGTDPTMADSDMDGISDKDELAYWANLWNMDSDNDGLINLLDADSDNDGINDGDEIASGSDPNIYNIPPQEPKLETGHVDIDHDWRRVTFKEQFIDPIVLAGSLSHNGTDPAVVRIRNVDPSGFEIKVQEWPYLDGWHISETISYLVIEQGQYQLSNGTRLEAGKFNSGEAEYHQPVLFDQSYSADPVVITSITTFNEADTVTGRIQNITTEGFEYRLQEQEANAPVHATETIAYIAFEPSSGSVTGQDYAAGKTADIVTHESFNIIYPKTFGTAPVFLAGMQTTDGEDPANIRQNNMDGFSVDVLIDEEQSGDSEIYHTTEVVGYIVFGQ